MLTVYDSNGVNLLVSPPTAQTVSLTTSSGTPFQVAVVVIENDVDLGDRLVQGQIEWNDGNHVDEFPFQLSSSGTLPMVSTQMLAPGDHNIGVYARNYRGPVYDEVRANFSVTVLPQTAQNQELRYLYGPILPKDVGFPNVRQWNFNLDKDTAVLASSVKMLIETETGERIMLPTYGTDLRALLFDPDIPGIETLIQEKITQALAIWEPRVTLTALSISREGRSVSVYMTLVSRLAQQEFQVSTSFQQ